MQGFQRAANNLAGARGMRLAGAGLAWLLAVALAVALALALALGGCAAPPRGGTITGQTGPLTHAAATPMALDASGRPVVFNDPPARPDSALCGAQAREANAIGGSLQDDQPAASGICASFTCYDPLTATYLGADGYRHVCR